jgi:hypothetical protein
VSADELAALATAGASALVAAMATDAWRTARLGIAQIFRRLDPKRGAAIEGQLDDHAALVQEADNPDEARQKLCGAWILELETLLHKYPTEAESISRLMEEILPGLPRAGRINVQAQFVNAAKNGIAFGVQDGNAYVNTYYGDDPVKADDADTSPLD